MTNALLIEGDRVLLIKKPRRNWYAIPGGKMEPCENINEAVHREIVEETGFHVIEMQLRSVCTFLIHNDKDLEDEWMMFTFLVKNYNGELLSETEEGTLEWVPISELGRYPMAKGDYSIISHALNGDARVMCATFHYSEEFELIKEKIDV
ncbi:NUDIX hydrolase [Halalkalibacillus sediminis]|uniref:NUDIX hydrolase n=1 Tax=Halalkalibacillus sediminis TaxID=2018042 RepID=UPI001EE42095|nr:NUDIX domain-containing protein [Halalkalibacillus sediminis]